MSRIRTLFIGTPTFALPSLESMSRDSFFELVGVLTQPDRPVGRNQTMNEPPIKTAAIKKGLTVYQPDRIRNFENELRELNLDLIVLVAYGQIIPESILNLPKYGCINVHGSLLPKYRGAAVIQAPIMNGDQSTGVTIMKMDPGLDTGPIITQAIINLSANETAASLFPKIAQLGADLLPTALRKYISGGLKSFAQDDNLASYVKILKKDDAKIDWKMAASEVERMVRAMYSWPITWTTWAGKSLKIIEVEPTSLQINQYKCGQVFVNNGMLCVQCGINSLVLKRVQLEGKTDMSAQEFMRGQSDIVHAILT